MIDATLRAYRDYPGRRVLVPWLGAGVRGACSLAA